MPCPFPGMDPFLELPPYWSDFTPKFLTAISNSLLSSLMPKYEVRIEEYLVLQHDEQRLHRLRPDVVISSHDRERGSLAVAVETSASTELDYPEFDPMTQRRLVLAHRATGRVITVMEILSPVNKSPGEDGIAAYERKREELLTSGCHLIEMDLLRGGQRLPMQGPLPPGDYFAYIGRKDRRPRCQVIGWPWRALLPQVPVPLLPEDGETTLDLAAAFRTAYDPSFYDRRLPYDRQLDPPLTEHDQEWVQERLESMTST
ncbi:MAG: DUF4058 family protein [Planctomycetales bacterium]|nr:DUF4058 family protein [Planctomycetales bacterium]